MPVADLGYVGRIQQMTPSASVLRNPMIVGILQNN